MLEIIVLITLILGLFFFVVGVLGLFRMPDAYTRLHATTKCDTLGIGLVLFSMMLYVGFSPSSIKMALIITFIWIGNPTAAHAIAKAAHSVGIPMVGIDTKQAGSYSEHTKEEGMPS